MGSASPRLTNSRNSRAAEIDEGLRDGEEPIGYVTRLAREKAEAVYALLATVNSPLVVLGAEMMPFTLIEYQSNDMVRPGIQCGVSTMPPE